MKKVNLKSLSKKAPAAQTHEITLHMDNELDGTVIAVKERLGFNEAASFVQSIVDSIIDMGTLTYMPEFGNFIERILILEYYAGISQDDCPLDQAYNLLYNTDLFSQIIYCINGDALQELLDGAHEKINFLVRLQESTAALRTEELLGAVEDMVKAGTQAAEAMNTQEFKDAMDTLNKLNGTDEKTKSTDAVANGQLVQFPFDDTVQGAVAEVAAAANAEPVKRTRRKKTVAKEVTDGEGNDAGA